MGDSYEFRHLEDLFHQLLDLEPSARPVFLDKRCGTDLDLRRKLESLLELNDTDGAALDPVSFSEEASPPERIGRYTITGKLGQGGMGEVFSAQDPELDRTIALKVLADEFARNQGWIQNFRQEARLLAAINHPHIATIYSFEEDGDRRFLTMEWIDGHDLARHVEASPLPWTEALPLARQIASALEAAHSRRIVHRDLKPKNIMITTKGVAKVLDFGIATTMGEETVAAYDPTTVESDENKGGIDVESNADRDAEHNAARDAETGGAIIGDVSSPPFGGSPGTPGYMSPEQARGERVDARTDIWAWACTVFVMVTGRNAFDGGTAEIRIEASLKKEPGWKLLPEDTPGRLRQLLRSCLNKCAEERPRSMTEVRRTLDEEIEASHRDRILEEAARHQTSKDTRAEVPHHIPVRLSSFVGRGSELAEVERLVGHSRLVSLLGFGGCGKTSLAQEVGRRLLKDFPDGVWFAQLVNVRGEDGLGAAVLDGLKVQGSPKEDPKQTVLNRLRGRNALLILDNCEQIVTEAGALATEILQKCPEVKVLTTTREALQIEGENTFAVPPLEVFSANGSGPKSGAIEAGLNRKIPGPPESADVTAEQASRSEAVRLFCERATSANPRFGLDDTNAGSVVEICRRLDGIPLALELAAARLRALPLEKLLERLADRFKILSGSRRGEVPHQQTLRATIDWSYDQLTEKEQKFLARLSVFVGGWTLESSEAVCSDRDMAPEMQEPIEEWEVLDLLTALVDKSLVQLGSSGLDTDGIGGGGPMPSRYTMLETVREYAQEKLDGSVEPATCETRHGEHFARLGTEEAVDALARDAAGFGEYESELENLVAASRRAMARNDEACATATYVASFEVFALRGPASSAIDLGEEILLAFASQVARARVLPALAGAQRIAGQMEEAHEHFEAALAIHREAGDRRGEGVALGNLGILHQEQGRLEEAREHYEAALAIHREVGNRQAEGIIIGNLGNLHRDQGRIEEAREHYEAALAIHREVGDRQAEGIVLGNLGILHQQQGRMEEAREHHEAALTIYREVGDRRNEGMVLGNLGVLHAVHGRMEEAREHYEAALAIHREVGSRRIEGTALANLGNLHQEQGRVEEACEHYEAALAIHREVGNRRREGHVLGSLGVLHAVYGRMEEAREHYEAALAIHREVGARHHEGRVLIDLGRLHKEQGRTEEARSHLDLAYGIFCELEDPSWKGSALVSIGALDMEEGQTKNARSRLEAGLEALRSDNAHLESAEALCELGELERREGNESAARSAMKEAESLANSIGHGSESPLRRRIAKMRTALDDGSHPD